MTYVEYKQLNPFQRFAHNFKKFILNIPHALTKFSRQSVMQLSDFSQV